MTQPLAEDAKFLEHFGVKGMKWGVRKERRAQKKAIKKDFYNAYRNEFRKEDNQRLSALNERNERLFAQGKFTEKHQSEFDNLHREISAVARKKTVDAMISTYGQTKLSDLRLENFLKTATSA